MSKLVKIRMSIATRYVGSEDVEIAEIDKDEWDQMTEEQREECMNELYNDFLAGANYGGCHVVEE